MNRPERIVPRGTLVAIGGNIDQSDEMEILRAIVDLPEGDTKVVEIIPTASSDPETVAREYVEAFQRVGVTSATAMDIQDREAANDDGFVQRILAADVVFLTGGDQLRITSILGGSAVLAALQGHYQRGGVIAGTSAGAVAMSQSMIYEGEEAQAMRKGTVKMTAGIGLFPRTVLDSHFTQRGRFKRLLEVVTGHPGMIGIGLDEDSAVIVHDGDQLEAIGSGAVVVVDGHEMRYTNISDVATGAAIAEEGILVHTLTRGHGYNLTERRYLQPTEVARRAKTKDVTPSVDPASGSGARPSAKGGGAAADPGGRP